MLDEKVSREVTFCKQDTRDAMRMLTALERSEFISKPDAYLLNIEGSLENALRHVKKARGKHA